MISNIFIIIGVTLFISKLIITQFNKNKPTKINVNNPNYCILVPARNESRVIEDLLLSIKSQTQKVPFENVYIIVEDKNDPTTKITKKYNANIIIRQKLELKRKGYALMEAIERITKTKNYDAYFIFDADNILDKNYISEMNKSFMSGYDIGIGYRLNKNKTNSIASSSHLIFTLVNELDNKNRNKHNINCNCSGTGFYITGKLINKLKTYPFHSLTEDYEISLYACTNNLTTTYNRNALFYDEQPTNYKTYLKQRTRWVSGYFEARKKYRKSLLKNINFKNKNFASNYNSFIGIYDLIFLLIGLILKMLNHPLLIPLIAYLVLMLLTIYLIHIEKNYKLNTSLYIKTILVHPLLLLSYILCLIKVLTSKEITWDTIEHKETLNK